MQWKGGLISTLLSYQVPIFSAFGQKPMSRAIHQNLDTAFVNVNALMRYLCRRGFVGQIHIEMSGYEADIHLSGDNQVEVIEKDHVTGRVADGEEALQRLLIRAGEPGGIVNVIQKDAFEMEVENTFVLKPEPQIPMVQARTVEAAMESAPLEIDVEGIVEMYSSSDFAKFFNAPIKEDEPVSASQNGALSDDDWMSLLKLTVEVLASVDRTLGAAGLQFEAAFAKASSELSEDYSFLRGIEYSGGRLTVDSRPTSAVFIAGISEVLRKLMSRLGSEPRFSQVHRSATEKMIDLVHRNKEEFDRFQITSPLYRVLGVNAYPLQ